MKDVKRVIRKVKQSDIDQLQTKLNLGYKMSIIIESEEEPTNTELMKRIAELETEVHILKMKPLFTPPAPIYNPLWGNIDGPIIHQPFCQTLGPSDEVESVVTVGNCDIWVASPDMNNPDHKIASRSWTKEEVEREQEALAGYEAAEEEDRIINKPMKGKEYVQNSANAVYEESLEDQVINMIEREKKEGKR